ncbi:MAG: DMT family transporter [Zestosphaera sp.]
MLGYGYAFITAVMQALNTAFTSRYRRSIHPILLTGLRALMSLAPAIAVCFLTDFRADTALTSVLLFIASALIGPGVGDAAYTKAIQMVGGGRAVIVANIYIFVAQALSALAGEVLGLGVVLGAVLAFTGSAISVSHNMNRGSASLRGICYAALASLSWGLGTVLNRVALNYAEPMSLLTIRMLVLTAVFIPAGLLTISAKKDYSIHTNLGNLIKCSIITGLVGWFSGMYFFLLSLATIGTASTVIVTASVPIMSMGMNKIVAKEPLGLRLVLGASLTSLGIGVAALLS